MKYLASIFLLSLLALNAHAQQAITIYESDYTGGLQLNRSTYSASTATLASLTSLIGMSGENQTWDFTSATYTQTADTATSTFVTYPGGAADASDADFTSATNVLESVPNTPPNTTYYDFIKLNSSGSWILGVSKDSSGVAIKEVGYNPPRQEASYPMTYMTNWESTSAWDSPSFPSGYSSTTTYRAKVDGWGTLKTPGQSTPVLRVLETTTNTTTYNGTQLGSTTTYAYQWLSGGSYTAYMALNATQTAPTSAEYYAPSGTNAVNYTPSTSGSGLGLLLTQNPASNSGTSVIYTLPNAGPVQVELMDELGRSVRMLQNGFSSAGPNVIAIEPQLLAAGTYFVRVEANGTSAMQKLVVTR
jgi:hypothetical protein